MFRPAIRPVTIFGLIDRDPAAVTSRGETLQPADGHVSG
jgi:hypothetical protein